MGNGIRRTGEMKMKKETITVPFESMPRLITGSFLTNDQVKKLKDTFKDFTVVVRCKDCKYGEQCIPPCDDRYCVFYDERHNEDWFCADGKRGEA